MAVRDGKKDMKLAPKTLIFDIETSLCLYAAYPSNKPQYLRDDNLIQDWYMICFGWQWEDHTKIHAYSLLDDKKRFAKYPTDDYAVVKKLHELVSEADAIVGHNMGRFDFKKLKARVIFHGLPPLPDVKVIDTLTQAKKASFTHNKLGFLNKQLGLAQKESHSPDMWLKILKGDAKAVEEAVKYCKADITATMELYKKLKPYMPKNALPNVNLWRGDGIECCPSCGSDDINKDAWSYSATVKRQRYECLSCRRRFTSKKAVKTVNMS